MLSQSSGNRGRPSACPRKTYPSYLSAVTLKMTSLVLFLILLLPPPLPPLPSNRSDHFCGSPFFFLSGRPIRCQNLVTLGPCILDEVSRGNVGRNTRKKKSSLFLHVHMYATHMHAYIRTQTPHEGRMSSTRLGKRTKEPLVTGVQPDEAGRGGVREGCCCTAFLNSHARGPEGTDGGVALCGL